MGLMDHHEYRASLKLWTIVPPILIALGTLGNILTIVVLSRPKSRQSSTATYLTCLAVSDLCFLYTGLLRQWINYTFEIDIRTLSSHGCRLHIFLVYFFSHFSSWLLVAVTLERVIGAWFPHKVKMGCTRKIAIIVILIIVACLFTLNLHWLVGFGEVVRVIDNITHIYTCKPVYEDYATFHQYTWPWIDLCMFSFIPFCILLVGNTAIIVKVVKSRRKCRTQIAGQANQAAVPVSKKSADKTTSLTAMLFVVNTVFFLTTTPISVFFVGQTYFIKNIETWHDVALYYLWWAVVNIMMYTNNAVNFILYFLSGSRFRQEVKVLFCGGMSSSVFGGKTTTAGTRVGPTSTVQTVAESVA